MPIEKIDKSIQLTFGYGDIDIVNGLLDVKETVGAVCLLEGKQGNEIGQHIAFDDGDGVYVEIEDTPVRMLFTQVKSIDVFIEMLQEVKQMMLDDTDDR